MPTLSIGFDTPEKASLYKDVLKQIIYENPKIRNQAQAMDHIFESFFDIHLRTKGFKNIIHRYRIEKIRSLELKHEKEMKKKNDQLLILKSQMKVLKKNNSRLILKQNKMKLQLKDKVKEIVDYIMLWG